MTFHSESYVPVQTGEKTRDRAAGLGRSLYLRVFKRLFDVAVVLLCALPVLAVVIPLALVVALDGGSPFYRQERVGRDGRIFRILKLRSMVTDADRHLATHLAADPAARAEWDAFQKLRNDPRITAIGAFLRRSSLDELPQLWNVLTGDMSLVGPRPMMPSQRAIYPGTEYYHMRPGITGLWQVSVRNESSFAQRAVFDRDYHLSMSLGTDLQLMLRTVSVVMRATGT